MTFEEVAPFEGLPPSSDYIPDDNEQRYIDRVEWLNDHPKWHRGTAFPHKSFNSDAFFLFDLGVVILDEPVAGLGAAPKVGTLPTLGVLDTITKKAKNDTLFTNVGYGLNKVLPFLEGTTTIVAVTSFGLSPNCTGVDGAYRVDEADDLTWLADVLAGNP